MENAGRTTDRDDHHPRVAAAKLLIHTLRVSRDRAPTTGVRFVIVVKKLLDSEDLSPQLFLA